MNEILPAVEFVVSKAKSVHIDHSAINHVASTFQIADIKHWLHEVPFDFAQFSPEEATNFIFLFYSLIFCFWGEPKWTIEYQGKAYDGSYGLLMSLVRAKAEGVPVLAWKYWQNISRDDFAHILRGNVEIPLFNERLQIVRSVGEEIENSLSHSIVTLVEQAQGDAQRLLLLIDQHFPSFRDVSTYQGRVIPFYKRAQLFIVDLFHFFNGKKFGAFSNIETITALSDYKLPQMLRHLGILCYEAELAKKVNQRIVIPHDSAEEIEIRAATVWSIELLRREVAKTLPTITNNQINDSLWLASQTSQAMLPYHRTPNIYY